MFNFPTLSVKYQGQNKNKCIQIVVFDQFQLVLHFVAEIHPSDGIRMILMFLDQRYPSPTKKFRTTHFEGLIQIKTKIGLSDQIQFQNLIFFFFTTHLQDLIQADISPEASRGEVSCPRTQHNLAWPGIELATF